VSLGVGGPASLNRDNLKYLSAVSTAPEAQLCSCLSRALSRLRPQFPKGIVSSVSFVSTTNTARSLAGCVSLALGTRSHLSGQQRKEKDTKAEDTTELTTKSASPSDGVVDHGTAAVAGSSPLDFLSLHDMWTRLAP